jgi:hypothetical protein
LLSFAKPSLEVVNVSSELPLLLSVLAGVFNSELQSVVISHQLMEFILMPPF